MATTKIVLRVDMPNVTQKLKAMKAISIISGVDSIAVDMKEQKITVIGLVDPVALVVKLRKLVRAEICSLGPLEKKKEEKKDGYKKDGGEMRAYKVVLPPEHEFTLEYLNRITNNFCEERIIGCDRYGAIYKGIRENGECMAVMKVHLKPGLNEEEFKNEVINKLWRVRHPHTIRLIGYCHHIAQVAVEHNGQHVSARVEERALCFEYLQGQSLDECISNEPCRLPWDTCYGIIRGICYGLGYLHKGLQHPIFHLDLKPTNIMLDRYMMPRIGGFGLSGFFDSLGTNNISEDTETSVYMPPEYINNHQISPQFDVFSLGVIIIQIMAGKNSYPKCADSHPEEFIQRVIEFWTKQVQETRLRDTSREVRTCIEIALKCVESDRMMRPTITEIVDKLDKIYNPDLSSIDQLRLTRKFTLDFLKRITNDFSEQNIVGRGGYGVIYKGVLDNGEEIAVKKLHQMLWIDDEKFKNELNNLMRVQHKNIVQLAGCCHHTEQIVAKYKGKLVAASVEQRVLCFEYLQGRSLDKHLCVVRSGGWEQRAVVRSSCGSGELASGAR